MCVTRAATIDVASVGTLVTPRNSPNIDAVDGDPQALDGIMQVVAYHPDLSNDFRIDYQVFVSVSALRDESVISSSQISENSVLSTVASSCGVGEFSKCYFTYSQKETPLVLGVEPRYIPSDIDSSETRITIKGFFGGLDSRQINISVGASSVCLSDGPITRDWTSHLAHTYTFSCKISK